MEFKLTKTDRLIVNAAAKDVDIPSLHCVHVTKGKIQATNGYILAERKIDYDGDNTLLDISDIAGHNDSKGLGGVVYTQDGENIKATGRDINIIKPAEGNFPNTEHLYPTEEPVFKIALGRSQLLALLKCLDKCEELIKFYFYDKEKPAKLTQGEDFTGLIMPMHAKWGDEK